MSIYLSSGTRVNIADETDLQVSSTLPVANYIVQVTPTGDYYLKRIDSFDQPKKYYGDVKTRTARIIGTYKSRSKSTGFCFRVSQVAARHCWHVRSVLSVRIKAFLL